jgi:peptidyl-prolyl cis-trans isomerase B (cyclophilin B)
MVQRASIAVSVLLPVLALAACGSSDKAASDDGAGASSSSAPASAPATSDATGCAYVPDGSDTAGKKVTPPPTTPQVSGSVTATMHTSAGDIDLDLDADVAPCTVNSVVALAKQGFFDGTHCHRLTTAQIFVLQCGDPTGAGSGGPGYRFADELDGAQTLATDEQATKSYDAQTGTDEVIKDYAPGTLAMANEGPGTNTNGSQFFLVYRDSPLPPAYTVFGTIGQAGMKVLTSVAAAGTADGGGDGAPKKSVEITSVTVK